MENTKRATLVVGADSDIGVRFLSELSGDVIAHGYAKPERLTDFSKPGTAVHPVVGDLSNAQGIHALISEINSLGFEIDRIVHLPSAPANNERFKNFDEQRFEREMNISTLSAALIFREYLPKMAKRKFGRVAAILTSYCIGTPPKYIAGYITAKYALMGLLKALAAEYAGKGITVNAVAPSMIETGFLQALPGFEIEANAKANPLGRNATPDDVVPVLKLMLQDDVPFLNGAIIPVTAGTTMF